MFAENKTVKARRLHFGTEKFKARKDTAKMLKLGEDIPAKREHDWREQVILTRERVKGFLGLKKAQMTKLINQLTNDNELNTWNTLNSDLFSV